MSTEYSDAQYASNYPDGVERHWWNLVRNGFIRRLVDKTCRADSAIMEIGCGRGIVVQYLRDRGFDCEGVELAVVEPMRGVVGYVRSGVSAFDLPEVDRARFDIVLLLDVLEHLPDPQDFIGRVLQAYPNARRLIVTLPACPELWTNYDEHYGHYRRYVLDDLPALFRDPALRVKASGYFFHGVYLPARLLAGAGKDRAVDIVPPKGLNRLIHRLVAFVLAIDARVLPSRWRGTSLFAVVEVGAGERGSD